MDKINLIGESVIFKKTLAKAKKIAHSSANILIGGETGTGKEEIARYMHQNSKRSEERFISINCAALPTDLMESELFGHVKGAFTTAHKTKEGLISSTKGGTLFLDEIAEMDISLQAKLLRFLDTGEYRKVGAVNNEYADVRVISATHQNLKKLISNNLFREDLYYRLSVLIIDMPALRCRDGDILLLANYFLKKITEKEHKKPLILENSAKLALKEYFYTGNIRELQNLIYKIVVFSEGGIITKEEINNIFSANVKNDVDNVIMINQKNKNFEPRPLIDIQKESIEAAIKFCNGNIPQAAALLQISPSTIYRKRSIYS